MTAKLRRELTFHQPLEAQEALQRRVDELLGEHLGSRLLEAGAGKHTRLSVPPDTYVVGVDTDAAALARNARLDERIVGDLMDYQPPAASFDVITCWYVLEQLDRPELMLARLAEWVRPGGLIVVAVPHLATPKAIMSKWAPHRLRVWYRRRIAGYANAGKPGFGPYPNTFRRSIAPQHLARTSIELGLAKVFEGFFEDAKQRNIRKRLRLTGMRWRAARGLMRAASLGRLDAAKTEYLVVFQKVDVAA